MSSPKSGSCLLTFIGCQWLINIQNCDGCIRYFALSFFQSSGMLQPYHPRTFPYVSTQAINGKFSKRRPFTKGTNVTPKSIQLHYHFNFNTITSSTPLQNIVSHSINQNILCYFLICPSPRQLLSSPTPPNIKEWR